jgi:hypothetical protein
MDNKYGKCPKCRNMLNSDNYSWSGGQTEYGTEFWTVEVDCDHCDWTLDGSGWCGEEGEANLPEVQEMIEKGDDYDEYDI